MDQVGGALNLFNKIASLLEGGSLAIGLKIGLLVVAGIAFVWFQSWLQKQAVNAAKAQEEKTAVTEQQRQAAESKTENDKAKTGSQAVDDFLKEI